MTLSTTGTGPGADPPEIVAPTPAATGAGVGLDAGTTDAKDSRPSKSERKGSWGWDDADRPRWDARTETVAEYDYEDADGTYLCTVRKGRHPDGEKRMTVSRRNRMRFGDRVEADDQREWQPGLGGAKPTLYRLPELLASAADLPIFIVEGEKDVETLRAWGLTATCNFGGAGTWRQEYAVHFAGRTVIVIPDNDPVGGAHAADVVQTVFPKAASVKVLDLPGLPDKGDVTDWAEAGGTKADLLRLAGDAPEITDPGTRALAAGVFAKSPDGKPLPTQGNVLLGLEKMGAAVRYDEFSRETLVTGLPGFGPQLCDAALTRMRLDAQRLYRLHVPKDTWNDIVLDHARRNSFHPVKDYWAGLEWDEIERLDTWLITYCGAADTLFNRAVSGLTLMAGVRRVKVPGTKFDTMPVLIGEQGGGKSTTVEILAVRPEWLMDGLELDADNKAVMELVRGKLLVEIPELAGMRRGDVEKTKAQISRTHDRARGAYERTVTQQPRTCVFIGTTNNDDFLRDMTGNRRFWPVTVGEFDLDALASDRDQLWAEAVMREAKGEPLTLPKELWGDAAEQQAERLARDPWEEVLAPRLDGQAGKVRTADLWGLLCMDDPARRTQDHNNRLGAVMRRLGWKRMRVRWDGEREYCYVKGDGATDELPKVEFHFGRDIR